MRMVWIVTMMILFTLPVGTIRANQMFTVEQLVNEALNTSPDLQRLCQIREQRRAELEASRARRFPTIDFLNTYTYDANPPSGFTVGVGELGSIPTGPMTSIDIPTDEVVILEDQDSLSFTVGIQINQPIFTWGKIESGIAVREALIELSSLEVDIKQDAIMTEVVAAFHSLFLLSSIQEVLGDQEKVGDQILDIADDSRLSGQLSETEFIETKMTIRELSLVQLAIDTQIQKTLVDLRFLTGIEDLSYEDLSPDGLEDMRRAIDDVDEDLYVEQALRENKTVRKSDAAIIVEERRYDVAVGGTALKPDVAVGVGLGYGGSKVPFVQDGWDTDNEYAASVTLSVSTSLYDGGSSAADVDAAASRKLQAGLQADSTRREIARYVVNTLRDLESIQEHQAYFEMRYKDATELVNRQKELLEVGGGSRLEYLNRRMEALKEKTNILQQELRYVLKYIELMNVIGRVSDIAGILR